MDPNFAIESERLRITTFLPTDAHCEFLVKLYNEPLFIEGEGQTDITTVEKARERIGGRFVEQYERYGYGNFLVSLKDSGKPIGAVSVMHVKDSIITLPDIGFAIIEEENNKGYATEAAKATIEWLKKERGLEGVLGFCAPNNARSRHVQEKIGLEFRGVVKCYQFGGSDDCCFISKGLGDIKEYGVGVPPPS